MKKLNNFYFNYYDDLFTKIYECHDFEFATSENNTYIF